ncbi:MAG: hypothetical protein HY858_15785 [Candidatus Solibacter usitatus]|nr:hypothetical protein [Candidatus Solibacter usitatus]
MTNKDAAQVKELAPKVCELARALAAKPAPQEESEKKAWESGVKYAREVEVFTEYALYSAAVQSPAPVAVELFEMLERQNPKSKYFSPGYGPYLAALNQTGQAAKIPAVAEKAVAHWPDDEDLQLVLADYDMNRNRVAEAGIHAERLVAVLLRHPPPEGVAPAAWERKRTQALGRGYWIAGQAHAAKGEYNLADSDLRNSLPLIAGNDAMLAGAYFQLGVANYHLGRQAMKFTQVQEAAAFSEKAAAIKGPYQQQAWTNAAVMRREAEKMRGAR